MEQIIEELKKQARESWIGRVGTERATHIEKYLRSKLEEYSEVTGLTQDEILRSWEAHRDYSAINYYQERNQPSIKGDKAKVFETLEDMINAIGEKKFRCPACGGVTSDPYKCNSGIEMSKGKVCNWNVNGLLSDLGKGVFVYCKDKAIGETMFMPLSWESNNK